MKVDFAELEAALAIDENALEEALQVQPEAYYQVGKEMARVMSQRAAAEKNQKEIEAGVDMENRQLAVANDQKMTEKGFENLRILNPKIKAASEEYLRLDYRYNRLKVLKESFEQRSWAINKLVDLYIHNYYGKTAHRAADDTVKNLNARQARVELRRERQ